MRHGDVKRLLTQRLDVMSLEGLMLSTAPLAFAAALTAFDAHGQGLRDCGGRSEAPAEVARVIDGRSFLLADGREVRLAAIETPLAVPGDEDEARVQAALAAKTALETLLLHREVHLLALSSGPDRYGRLVAYAVIRTSSGEALVQQLQSREIEAEAQLRLEQAKLDVLHDQLERVMQTLDKASQPPDNGRH